MKESHRNYHPRLSRRTLPFYRKATDSGICQAFEEGRAWDGLSLCSVSGTSFKSIPGDQSPSFFGFAEGKSKSIGGTNDVLA
jgi:hypothetical protein